MGRIIDISNQSAGLSVRHRQLVIKLAEDEHIVPLEDIAALVVANPAIHYSQAVLTGLLDNGGMLVICNEKHLPCGMLLPLTGHFAQNERFVAQADCPQPTRKRLWQTIIRAKIKAQARLLEQHLGDNIGLNVLASKVRSGDPDNLEGQAARRYWPVLFGKSFRRDPAGPEPNIHLNYGYALLRAIVARSISAAGLHPTLGIHHHNRYDAYCLADDLMEPFRPLVDAFVKELWSQREGAPTLDKETRSHLIKSICIDGYSGGKQTRTLSDHCNKLASSLAKVFLGQLKTITIPVLSHVEETA